MHVGEPRRRGRESRRRAARGAARSSSRSRPVNPPAQQRGGLCRAPSPSSRSRWTPVICISRTVERFTGTWWATSRPAASAWVPGPNWARPEAWSGARPTPVVAAAAASPGLDQVLGHPWRRWRLRLVTCRLGGGHRRSARSAPHPAQTGLADTRSSVGPRPGASWSRLARPLAPRRPLADRDDRFRRWPGLGLSNTGSEDGGFPEFEDRPCCRLQSPIRAACRSTSCRRSTITARNSATTAPDHQDGGDDSDTSTWSRTPTPRRLRAIDQNRTRHRLKLNSYVRPAGRLQTSAGARPRSELFRRSGTLPRR